MALTLLAKRRCVGVEAAKDAHDILAGRAQLLPALAQRGGVGCLFGAVAAVAASPIRGADGAAPGMRHRTEAGRSPRHHHADGAAQLALHAHTVRRRIWLAPVQVGADDFYELAFIDGTAAQLKVNRDVV